MKLDTLLRAAQILRTRPSYGMPLDHLHACLTEELGVAAGTYADVYRELKKRPQSFMVLEAPETTAGLGDVIRVALTEPEDGRDDAMSLAATTMCELWRYASTDDLLRDSLARAADELEDISSALQAGVALPPTTRARDLPPQHESPPPHSR